MNTLAVAISIILLPGLVASVICDKITVHSPRWNAFKYSIYSFLFGVLSYGFLQILKAIFLFGSVFFCFTQNPGKLKLDIWSVIYQPTPNVPLLEVALATSIAPLIAFSASWIVNHKIINKISRKYGLSLKYGDENLFSYFLNIQDVSWVYIPDKEKELTYMGEVVSFSECDSIQEILLRDVSVFSYEESKFLYNLSLVYLSKPVGSFVIEVPAKENEESTDGKKTD